MMKRILSGVLLVAFLLTLLPVPLRAQQSESLYGDANADGRIDLNDVLAIRRYVAEEVPSNFDLTNADVNADGKVDLADLLVMKKYMAEWDIDLGPELLTVRFYDGDRLIDSFQVRKGSPLGKTPSVEKTSKASGIFAGWYLDKECTLPFYAENEVTQNTDVYAKYDAYDGLAETVTVDSFSKLDVPTDHSLVVKGTGDAAAALTLVVKDGSVAPKLKVTDNGDGTFTVTAEGGFRAGSAYEVKLAEGFYFVGEAGVLPETVRTATFTVKKEIVDNMKLNADIVYIADTAGIRYEKVDSDGDGKFDDTVEVLEPKMTFDPQGSKATVTGANTLGLEIGDIVCFYKGTAPEDRVYTGPNASAYPNEPEVYAKVTGVTANAIAFTSLSQEEVSQVYDIPDVFPLKTAAADNQVNLSALDLEVYALYGLETPTLAYAKERIAVGDFVAVYEKATEDGTGTTVGKITAYNAATGEITFAVCTAEDIVNARSIYVQPAIRGDELVSQETKQEIEAVMLSQIRESGFAEEAAYTLATLASQTDGFRNMQAALLNAETGKPLTDAEIELLSLGASFELTEGVTLSVELITKGDELHFDDGVQLAVGIQAEFKVEAEEGSIVIQLNASFIEELEIKPTVDGELTYKEILGIPIPNGVRIAANIDVKNYTAYDFDVMAYTVGAEEQDTWDKLKDIMENPTKITSMLSDSKLIPQKYADKLEKVSDIFATIEELEKKLSDAQAKYKEDKETVEGYAEDLEALWAVVEDMHQKDTQGQLFTKETWADAAKELSKTNIAQELLGLTEDGITDGDAGVDNDASIKSVDELMERYSEMLQQETDWVTLLDQKVFEGGGGLYVINFMIEVDFMIRANMSIAVGSTLEYETGKRYAFWFKVGLYKPTGGSSTMDLIDESLAFQFYVMGKLEIKMGARIILGVNLGCNDVAYIGIYSEVGPYVKLYGFFVYTYEQMRQANTLNPIKTVRKMGAVYLETGIYLIVGVEASAVMGLFEASYDFLNEEFPILTAGKEHFPYDFSYEVLEDEKIIIRDSDGNSQNGVTMVLPEELRAVKTMILTSGMTVDRIFDYGDYNISFSNPNFSLDPETGEILVNVPEGIRSMECEMRLTYRYGKMAFSDYDIGICLPLFWTNLSTEELSEYYTASVRVGNDQDGYETVWSKRMLKNVEFTLPTEAQIKELIGYSELKYVSGAYAESYDTGKGIIENTVYDFKVIPRRYSITVSGIEGAQSSQTFTAKFGEAFDFSALEGTGTRDSKNGIYTAFYSVTTDATVTVGKDAAGKPVVEPLNLNSPISARMAEALQKGVTAKANYVDDSVTATVTFSGLVQEDWIQTLPKGGLLELKPIEELALQNDLAVKDITPALGAVFGNTTYTVILGKLTGESYTVGFEENGGSPVADITKIGGSLLGALPVPEKTGYTFSGWYTDNGTFAKPFQDRLVPKENVTLYAKWTAKESTVSFHINGGTSETPAPITVTYDGTYGTLPVAERIGYGFTGWFTAAEGGVQVKETTKVTAVQPHTLYAQWVKLKDIPREVFSFTKPANPVYDPNAEIDNSANVTFTPEDGATYQLSDFVIEYKLDGDSSGYVQKPKNAGTYIARVSRPADGVYGKFEATYTAVLTVDKAQGKILDPEEIVSKLAYESFYSNLMMTNSVTQGVDYIGDEGCFQYGISNYNTPTTKRYHSGTGYVDEPNYVHWSDSNLFNNVYDDRSLSLSSNLYIWVRLKEGPNYLGDPTIVINPTPVTVKAPKSIWCESGLTYKLTIKTKDKLNAGTDSHIWTAFDQCPSKQDSWSNGSFERNDTDTKWISAGSGYAHRNSLETIRMHIRFEEAGLAPGWDCDWMKLDVYYNNQLLFAGNQVSVNQNFSGNTSDYFDLTAPGGYVQSKVKLIGYDQLAAEVPVSSTGEAFSWSWDGSMTSSIFGSKVYNAYEYVNAPVLTVSFGNADYDKFITRSINGFTVDRAGLAAAMEKNGATGITLRTAFEFKGIDGKNSVSEDCSKFTQNVKFILE